MPVKTVMVRVALLAFGVALTVSGCSSDTVDSDISAETAASASGSTASKSTGPSRALVKWAGQMCKATKLFETMKTNSAIEVEDISHPPADALIGAEFSAMGYLGDTRTSLDEVAKGFDAVRRSGIVAADRLHDNLSKEVARVRPKITDLTDPSAHTSSAEDAVDRAEHVGKLIASLKMPKPDLAAVASPEPKLSAAYGTAPECAPAGPLPEAADGTDAGACKDGDCEILVTKKVHLVVGAWQVSVSLTETKATVRNSGAKGAVAEAWMSTGGTGTFGEGGDELIVKAIAVNKDGAVLTFRTK
ncbi:hypothetical protein ACIQWB_04040 [Streptomyces olivaceus]|uniref:hypothetical protein n=1 Tax=Streptomyces olivaceus TaxID=47716 RepID=UPI0037F3C365